MKIDKATPSTAANTATELAQHNKAAKPASGQTPATNVSLGSATAQLRAMETSIASTPAINSAKIAEIKQAISEGRFQVNASAIADGLISSVHDMLTVAPPRR